MSAASQAPALAMLAPQLLVAEGSVGLPGPVRWVAGFTTGPDTAPMLQRVSLQAEIDARRRPGPVEWRLESQELRLAGTAPARIVQGEAHSLSIALEAAVAAAGRTPGSESLPLGPAFVLLQKEPGLPRVWGCAGLLAMPGPLPGVLGRVCFIRERLGGPHPGFEGMLEGEALRRGAPLLWRWSAATLAEAAEQGRQALLGAALPLAHSSRPAG
jgi:hypothetical protein